MDRPQTFRPVAEAARAFGLTPQTLYNWRNSGRVTAYRIGGKALVDIDELLAMVEKGRVWRGGGSE